MTVTSLYRHYDAAGVLLYVGISVSAPARLAQHVSGSHWSDEIARVEIEKHPTREAAEAAERQAIRSEGPLHNKLHRFALDASDLSDTQTALDWLRDQIAASGMTQRTVGVALGLSESSMSKVMSGARKITGDEMLKLVRLFGFALVPADEAAA